MQKVNISLLQTDAVGPVVATDGGVTVDVTQDDSTLYGAFDQQNGILSINIPNIGKLAISGLPTIYNIGFGPEGGPGTDGRDGIDGLSGRDGRRGSDGCPGPRGLDGNTGRQGYVGVRGPAGPTGATGATGRDGSPGRVEIYIQDTDPSIDNDVSPGALWVRP